MAETIETVRIERQGSTTAVVWRHPPLNVFDHELLLRLAHALRSEEVGRSNLLVLRGGYGVWSAGLSVADHLGERLRPMLAAFRDLLRAIWEVPIPTLAVVEGPCLGGGLELLLPCDIALASSSATFGQPEIKLGVLPPAALAALGGQTFSKVAGELLFTGRTITADRAAEVGLVSRTVPAAQLEGEVEGLQRTFSGLRHEALRLLKRVRQAAHPFPWEGLGRAEEVYLEELAALPAAEEGLRAFLEKRAPQWPAGGG